MRISWTCAVRNAVDSPETTVSTYGSASEKEERRRKNKMNKLAVLTKFQFGTSAMVASDFEGLRGYGTLEYEGQVPFVLLHMACPCHPYIQSLPTLIYAYVWEDYNSGKVLAFSQRIAVA